MDQPNFAYGAMLQGSTQALSALAVHPASGAFVELTDWCSRVTGSLGKIGQDVALMAQDGVGEIVLAGGGGSSAMPHKHNPVKAEWLVALARYTAIEAGGMHHAMVHEQERSGAAWALEWLLLPNVVQSAGAALKLAGELLDAIDALGSPSGET